MQSHHKAQQIVWFDSPTQAIPGPLKFEKRDQDYKSGIIMYEYVPGPIVVKRKKDDCEVLANTLNKAIKIYYMQNYKSAEKVYIEPFFRTKKSLFITSWDVEKLKNEMPSIFSEAPIVPPVNVVQTNPIPEMQQTSITANTQSSDADLLFPPEAILEFAETVANEPEEDFLSFSTKNRLELNTSEQVNPSASKKQKTNDVNKEKVRVFFQEYRSENKYNFSIFQNPAHIIDREKAQGIFQEMTSSNKNTPIQLTTINQTQFQTLVQEFSTQNPVEQKGFVTSSDKELNKKLIESKRRKKRASKEIDKKRIDKEKIEKLYQDYTAAQNFESLGQTDAGVVLDTLNPPLFGENLLDSSLMAENSNTLFGQNYSLPQSENVEADTQQQDEDEVFKFLENNN